MEIIDGNGLNGQEKTLTDQDRARQDRANLRRRINRQLLKENQKLASIRWSEGERSDHLISRYTAITDLKDLAHQVGIHTCEFCGRRAPYKIDGVRVCSACAEKL